VRKNLLKNSYPFGKKMLENRRGGIFFYSHCIRRQYRLSNTAVMCGGYWIINSLSYRILCNQMRCCTAITSHLWNTTFRVTLPLSL